MIAKCEKEAEAKATEETYRDEQMANQAEMEAELANLAKTQAEMDNFRAEESANFRVARQARTRCSSRLFQQLKPGCT